MEIPTLKVLNIKKNDLGNEGFELISKSLKNHKTIETLELDGKFTQKFNSKCRI
jgi:hypothetical protein